MNLSELINEDNVTFELFDVNKTEQQQLDEYAVFRTLKEVFVYVSVTLGIPGNILSAIVWLRLHVASKNSSAVYLAALAINDIVYLLIEHSYEMIICVYWLWYCLWFLSTSTEYIEPVLVLGFSVERLIAITYLVHFRINIQKEKRAGKRKLHNNNNNNNNKQKN